jgi:hypothetical protein
MPRAFHGLNRAAVDRNHLAEFVQVGRASFLQGAYAVLGDATVAAARAVLATLE